MDSIVQQFEHSKFGNFMFKLCAKWTKFIVKHKWLYYLLACTWGFVLTFVGLFITLVLAFAKIFNHNIKFNKYCWVYNIKCGEWWGGFEMGLMFVRDQKSSDYHINPHEFGHTFQNCLFGPLMLFLVSLPSCIRYWYREIAERKGKKIKTDYDQAWFEDAATQCGRYAEAHIMSNK